MKSQVNSSLLNNSTQHTKAQQTSKLHKQIDNTNREIVKCYENHHSAILKIQSMLGLSNPPSNLNYFTEPQFSDPNNNINNNNLPYGFNTNQFHPFQFEDPELETNSKFPLLLALNDEEILYYSCKYFVIYNIVSKEYQIINKDIKNCTLKAMKRFNTTDSESKLIVCIYQTNETQQNTFIALLSIKTDYESRTSRNDNRYSWKVFKISTQPILIENFAYFPKKNYLYLVVNKQTVSQKYVVPQHHFVNNNNNFFVQTNNNNNEKNITQYLYIYDLNKEIFHLNQQIRSNTVGFFVQFLSLEDFDKVYLCGRNYFRQWVVNFNEKSMKESNVRNIQRVLKNKFIVDLQQIQRYSMKLQPDHQLQEIPFLNPHLQPTSPILLQPSKLIIILTHQEVLLIKSNELICAFSPEQNINKQSKTKDNIEKQLQNSFNQIHKMKFLFDEYQEMKDKEDYMSRQNQMKNTFSNGAFDSINQKNNKQNVFHFTALSKSWKTQNQNLYIAIANSKYVVLIYEIVDFQLRLYTEFDCSAHDNINLSLKSIVPLQCGDILLCMNEKNQVHYINQQNSQLESQSVEIKSLWGNGHLHNGQIYAISSPMIQNIMCTVGDDQTFKLWSMKKNQRTILFESKPTSNLIPLGITMHPNGTIICVNFQREIKLYSILPTEFYEMTNIKTNYCPMQLKYSDRGEFLVSNQGSVLIFYQSFSLKTLGYIEPADIQFKIVDFKLSKNAEYICFLTEDNGCFLQSIEMGEMSQWQHFVPAHKQVEPYTAFYFDKFQNSQNKQKQKSIFQPTINEKKKSHDLFVGATRNKYMVIYENECSKLVAEFPVIDCFIVDMEIIGNLMFVATSKATIRVYNWPILQSQLELQVVNVQTNQIRYKAPKYDQYQIWHETIPILRIHKLNFTNELLVSNNLGNIAVFSFQETKNKKVIYEEVPTERKKMEQLINQMFYIKRSEIQKRNKLIEKTENDILKVENQLSREKISLERKLEEEQGNAGRGYEMKNQLQQAVKLEYLQKQEEQISLLKEQIRNRQIELQELKQFIAKDYEEKREYENGRNQKVTREIREVVVRHKDRIKRKIQEHKMSIRDKKREYLAKVKQVQEKFDQEVVEMYEAKLEELANNVVSSDNNDSYGNNILDINNEKNINNIRTTNNNKNNEILVNLLADNNHNMTLSSLQDDNIEFFNQNIRGLVEKLQNVQQMGNNSKVSSEKNNKEEKNWRNSSSGSLNNHNSSNQTNTLITSVTQQQQSYVNTNNSNNTANSSTINNKNNNTTQKLKRQGIQNLQLNEKPFLKKAVKLSQNKQTQQKLNKLQKAHQVMLNQFNYEIIQEMTSKENQDILIQSMRVEELLKNNMDLEKQILLLKMKVNDMEKQDEFLQKDFQAKLEEYNLARYKNLNLHCEVLKMQNQLVQRKQVLDNKEQIVMLAFQQKEKLQNYKQLVKGSLSKLQQRKQQLREVFSKKQTDLNIIFNQLVNEIHKMENKKDSIQKLQRKMKQATKQQENKQQQLNQVISKLKDIKKYLLLEKMSEENSQKSIFQYEEQLIQTINFLKKRLFMESIKEKKNKQLKKSSLNQVLKQNKNLLEECNQLRAEGIQYENEIKNLSDKLKQANKMITIETKLKSQTNVVHEQTNQLQIMKKLFKMQLEQFQEKDEEQQIQKKQTQSQQNKSVSSKRNVVGNGLKPQVHYDAEQLNKQLGKLQEQNYTQHKPFKLSKYIEAQTYEKI